MRCQLTFARGDEPLRCQGASTSTHLAPGTRRSASPGEHRNGVYPADQAFCMRYPRRRRASRTVGLSDLRGISAIAAREERRLNAQTATSNPPVRVALRRWAIWATANEDVNDRRAPQPAPFSSRANDPPQPSANPTTRPSSPVSPLGPAARFCIVTPRWQFNLVSRP